MGDSNNTAVIYLAWLPYGIGHFKNFINSYLKHDAAYPHQLIIVFNGLAIDHPNKPEEYLSWLQSQNIHNYICLYYQNGQNLAVYRQAATELNHQYLLFLNTYTEIQAPGWLKHYTNNFDAGTGLIAATGSLQSYYSSVFQKHTTGWEAARGCLYNFRKYKLFVKAFFYWRFLFKPFPNPHVRTSAFMIKRSSFLEMNAGALDTKFKAYQFENGRNSLTAFYLKKGLKVLVLDKHGKTFEPAGWKKSGTFWINNQENLLVADNQTKLYAVATPSEKKEMTRLAWGTA